MKAIIKNKLYDTDKAELFKVLWLPDRKELKIYKTLKGAIFAVNEEEEYIIDELDLKEQLKTPACLDAYIELFGEPEKA